MKGKQLHFFNLKWRAYSKWQQALIGIVPVAIICASIWLFKPSWLHYVIIGGYAIGLSYSIWSMTRKNSLHWIKDNSCKLKIDGIKLDIDLKFLSQVWIENEELNIRRINRVDTFPIGHLRTEDVGKLVRLLGEFEQQKA